MIKSTLKQRRALNQQGEAVAMAACQRHDTLVAMREAEKVLAQLKDNYNVAVSHHEAAINRFNAMVAQLGQMTSSNDE